MAVTVAGLKAEVLLRCPLLLTANPKGYAAAAAPAYPVMDPPLRSAIVAAGGAVADAAVVTDADLATAGATAAGAEKVGDIFLLLLFRDACMAFQAVDVAAGGTGSNQKTDQAYPRLRNAYHDQEALVYRKYNLVLTGGTGGGVVPAGAAATSQAIRGGRFDPPPIPRGGVVPGLATPGLAYPGADPRTGRRYPWPNGYGW